MKFIFELHLLFSVYSIHSHVIVAYAPQFILLYLIWGDSIPVAEMRASD